MRFTASATLGAAAALSLTFPLALSGQTWTPAQREVLDVVDGYTQATLDADVDRIMAYFHEDFQGWEYGEDMLLDRDRMESLVEGFYAGLEVVAFDIEPVAVTVDGRTAAVHVRYAETFRPLSTESEQSVSGKWTMVLVRENEAWRFITWAWAQDDP